VQIELADRRSDDLPVRKNLSAGGGGGSMFSGSGHTLGGTARPRGGSGGSGGNQLGGKVGAPSSGAEGEGGAGGGGGEALAGLVVSLTAVARQLTVEDGLVPAGLVASFLVAHLTGFAPNLGWALVGGGLGWVGRQRLRTTRQEQAVEARRSRLAVRADLPTTRLQVRLPGQRRKVTRRGETRRGETRR
jgi:hypothetical protein